MKGNILIIEDDQAIRETLEQIIAYFGFDVSLAGNGREGLDLLLSAPPPCLILLDLMMPVMNGWELLSSIKEDDKLKTIPIVVISAFSYKGDLSEEYKSVVGFIRKPVSLDSLQLYLEKYCSR